MYIVHWHHHIYQLVGFLFGSLREINAKSMKHRERGGEDIRGWNKTQTWNWKKKNGNCNGVTDLIWIHVEIIYKTVCTLYIDVSCEQHSTLSNRQTFHWNWTSEPTPSCRHTHTHSRITMNRRKICERLSEKQQKNDKKKSFVQIPWKEIHNPIHPAELLEAPRAHSHTEEIISFLNRNKLREMNFAFSWNKFLWGCLDWSIYVAQWNRRCQLSCSWIN